MNRSSVIVAAVGLALLGAIIPIAAMLYFSRVLATEKEHQRLALIAERIISRAGISLTDATRALHEINTFNGTPCSSAHIARMREITISTRAIEEIGYFEGGVMKCTSWGLPEGEVLETAPDFTIAGGIGVIINVQPLVAQKTPMMALQYHAYNVLIDPVRFVDVIVDPNVKLAIATDNGAFVARLNNPDRALVDKIIDGPRDKGVQDSYLFALSRAHRWVAVAMELSLIHI